MRRFMRDQRGNIAITFALALIPICILIGGAVDFSRAMSAKRQLRDTLDGAALAIAGVPNFTQSQAEQIATDFATANFPTQDLSSAAKIDSVAFNDTSVTINGSADVPTSMLDLIGMDSIKVTTDTTVDRAGMNVEAALALDITGSMAGSRITDLKTAANDFIDTVVQDIQTPYTSKAAIVPYSNSVNVGNLASQVRGATLPNANAACTKSPYGFGCNQYTFTNASGSKTTFSVTNCVSERTGTDAYKDTAPSSTYLGFVYAGSNNPCVGSSIVPLTSNKSTLHATVNGMSAGGSTAGHLGIAWGWYMLSPNFGYLFPSSMPASYSDKKTMKVAVLMTDGEFNTMYCSGVISKDAESGSGSSTEHNNCNAPNGRSFTQAKALCDNMKAAGVIVYTVGFTITKGGEAETLLKQCASSPNAPYFNTPVTGSDLKTVFKTIAKSISQLRISH